jgi:hypothetical protein
MGPAVVFFQPLPETEYNRGEFGYHIHQVEEDVGGNDPSTLFQAKNGSVNRVGRCTCSLPGKRLLFVEDSDNKSSFETCVPPDHSNQILHDLLFRDSGFSISPKYLTMCVALKMQASRQLHVRSTCLMVYFEVSGWAKLFCVMNRIIGPLVDNKHGERRIPWVNSRYPQN